jgi:predicted O-linked N-acetylglucosamine transferase (SPINDLY family)
VGGRAQAASAAFERGKQLHQAGQWQQAEILYRQALAVDPGHADSLHQLGVLALQSGQPDRALACFDQAIKLQPMAPYHNDRGNALRHLGRLSDAEAAYREALRLRGRFPDALNNLCTALLMLGRFADAEVCGRKAVRLKPDSPEAHNYLGHALSQLGRIAEAEACYRAALRLNPNSPDAWNNLGCCLKDLDRAADAEPCFRAALRLQPNSAEALANLADALHKLERSEEAESCCRAALRLKTDFPTAHNTLGSILGALGHLAEAEASCRAALRLQPNFALAHNNLGWILVKQRRPADAVDCFRAALRLSPNFPEAYNNLGSTLVKLGRFSEAQGQFENALRLRPTFLEAEMNLANLMLAQCRHDDVIRQYERILARDPQLISARRGLLLALPYIPDLEPSGSFAIHRGFGKAASRSAHPLPQAEDRNPDRRIRVGWLSSDFYGHPVGRNLELIFAHHDRAAFETFCYADVKTPDVMTERLRRRADLWRSISGLSDAAVAKLICADRVDIMIYLAGRFDQNRPQVAAWRPAPVQISLFDGATSGLAEMDYFIADRVTIPPQHTERFTERALRLPNFYLHAVPMDDPAPGTPPCLSRGHATFGCFHNPAKLNSKVLACWADILRRIPHARIRFKYIDLFGSEELRELIRGRLGIEFADRIEFDVANSTLERHLAQYNEVDISLDPFPFNGSTATFEALWMGVPVVALAGDRFMGRWAASMLTKVGLHESIAATPETYVEIAVRLAADPARLIELRQDLRERIHRSALCDGPRTMRSLDRALRAVWRKWCRDQSRPSPPALSPAGCFSPGTRTN